MRSKLLQKISHSKPTSQMALHRACPEAEIIITADGGHSETESPNSRALVAQSSCDLRLQEQRTG
jgi:hypothetical protein